MKIAVDLTDSQALALAQMTKRICWEHIYALSNRFDPYPDGRAESDHMLDGINSLRRALAKEGVDPR